MRNRKEESLVIRLQKSNLFLYALIAAFVLFIITRSLLFAVLTGLFLIALFIVDIAAGVAAHGLLKEIFEIVVALVIVAAFWFGLGALLITPSPISAIVSCSLLPAFERGDMIILQGINPDEIKAPEIEITEEEFFQLRVPAPIQPCREIASILGIDENDIITEKNCLCGKVGPLDYICDVVEVRFKDGEVKKMIVANKIAIKGKEIKENLSNDVIVYIPRKNERALAAEKAAGVQIPTGDIIHRVFAKIKVVKIVGEHRVTETYLLMKGDNNQWFDTVFYELPRVGLPKTDLVGRFSSAFGSIDGDVKGKVITRIPFLGYLKLFLFGMFAEPPGCERVILH